MASAVLVDNDVALKIACYSLVDETLKATTVGDVPPAMLGVARFVIRGRLARARDIVDAERACAAFERLLQASSLVEPDEGELAFAADLEAEASLERQLENARANPNPPWARKRTRRKTVPPMPRRKKGSALCGVYLEEALDDFKRSFAVPLRRPLPFKINLCEGGDVVTRDGVVVGIWELDENTQVSFLPNDASEPLFLDMPLGRLCVQIREWYEANTGDVIY